MMATPVSACALGLRVPPCASVRETAAFIRRAEEAGLDSVWVPDSQLLWRDVFATLTAAALKTERIGLGTAVTNVVTRHPTVVAAAAATVAEVSGERFTLGVGAGNSSVAPVGLKSSRTGELRHALTMIRELLSGERTQVAEDRVGRLQCAAPSVEVYLAATGPRNLALSGEAADGTILLGGIDEQAVQRGADLAAAGRATAGRPNDGALYVTAHALITDDLLRDARSFKPVCVAIAQGGGMPKMQEAGIDVQLPDRMPDIYPDLLHAEDWDAAVSACDEMVSDDDAVVFVQEFCLAGTAAEVSAQLAVIARAGATGVILQHVGSYDFPEKLLAGISQLRF